VSFVVASYNVLAECYVRPDRYRHVDPAALIPSARRRALIEHIRRCQADVICLQEVERDFYDALCLALSDHTSEFASVSDRRRDGCAVLIKSPRLAIEQAQPVLFRDGRGHCALMVTARIDGRRLGIATTHLPWQDPQRAQDPERTKDPNVAQQSLRTLAGLIEREPSPCDAWVITGDFNAPPKTDTARELLAHGFIDAFAAQPHAYTCNVGRDAARIDYVFTRGLIPEALPVRAIDADTPLPSLDEPSDHLLIAARCSWAR